MAYKYRNRCFNIFSTGKFESEYVSREVNDKGQCLCSNIMFLFVQYFSFVKFLCEFDLWSLSTSLFDLSLGLRIVLKMHHCLIIALSATLLSQETFSVLFVPCTFQRTANTFLDFVSFVGRMVMHFVMYRNLLELTPASMICKDSDKNKCKNFQNCI